MTRALLSLLLAAGAVGPGWKSSSFESMSTRIDVLLPEEHAAHARVVEQTFHDVELKCSEWRPASPIGEVNRAAGGAAQPVPDDVRALLERGVELGALTGGAFDVTWAALWGLWDFRAAQPTVPSVEVTGERARLVDYKKLVIDDEKGTARLKEAGMKIGLGGIAKGHALDVAARELRARGVKSFLLSAGGQVYAGGTHEGRRWRVGIRDPRGPPDEYFAYLDVEDASVSTSGDYESFFLEGGVRYHHILDPRTGRPARGTRSATVISADATLADALSTALVIMGKERGLALVERLAGVEAVIVDDEGAVHASRGLEGRLVVLRAPRRS